ncbi:1-acyl-sn-glycerol-3-phosphate acyltransferase [Rhodobacter sp. NTK016B]|uniref:1-acyl-sn-glycerol-3-phosphate acyltransferase n=1 Tax=Rhodobacter sp. NTK016B TaxID=2759676 RepID=UPI001A8D7283|nr:1-acyl-sn-glycerol-3-phosphate acyltransferase [Rhodobacter sp. NTK016B]MBN8292721.1 1-acyl-sn-glycerol-3-phosphate acyltransferase [Rhodobacter sp. NTK016B]
MFQRVDLPLWLLILILLFAAVAFLSHFLFPSVRWFLRRRMERAVEELNKRLERPIRPFNLTRRHDQVIRLAYDPQVMQAVSDYARDQGIPLSVAHEKARLYAREIVPGFSTATYFGFAIRVARGLSRLFYKVHLNRGTVRTLRDIHPDSAVIFVMNHRSNMDYVLVTWLAARRSTLSYAVGEWARVWPLKGLIRGMGAYFIRRRYSTDLYRAVLARYVQMSVQEGVTQAMFPEGGLSLTGTVGSARRGLLTYIVRDFDPSKEKDVVFVPVALNYDRVLEDAVLVKAGETGDRRFRLRIFEALGWLIWILWQKLLRRTSTYGHAAVSFGEPLSLRGYLHDHPESGTDTLADELMGRIRGAVPLLPVPLAAAALVRLGMPGGGAVSRGDLAAQMRVLVDEAAALGAQMHLIDGEIEPSVDFAVEAMARHGLIRRDDMTIHLQSGEEATLAYYAASVLQRLEEPMPAGLSEQGAGGATLRATRVIPEVAET